MSLPFDAEAKLEELSLVSGDYSLFGIFLNPKTGEMGTYSSHNFPPGRVLGFLQNAVEQMISAAANNELEYVGGDNGLAQGSTAEPDEFGAIIRGDEIVH